MRLEQLQAFLAVARTGSFQEAAKQCGVTQSTVSRQIQNLEAELGLPLLYRGGQSKLTLAGEQLLPRSQRILAEWQEGGAVDLRFAGREAARVMCGCHSLRLCPLSAAGAATILPALSPGATAGDLPG